MKVLLAILIALMFSSAATIARADVAPAFPWKTYADVPIIEAVPVGQFCDDTVTVVSVNEEWRVFSSATKDLFIHYSDGDGSPDYAYFATGVVGGAITVHRVMTIDEAKRLYADPCSYFSEQEA